MSLQDDYIRTLRKSTIRSNPPRHKVFVSYHHVEPDQSYRNRFEVLFHAIHDVLISQSVQLGDIDPNIKTDTIRDRIRDEHIAESTVTIILVGPTTWQRKHVDWEISSSIRETKKNSRCGIFGILLPHHPNFGPNRGYSPGIIPPRLHDNIRKGYAKLYDWTENPASIQKWIEEASQIRNKVEPDNSYPHFVSNKSATYWC